jgi:hypothetical protein
MRKSESKWNHVGGFGAGIIMGLSLVTPVFAATSGQTQEWTSILLFGSLALFVVGVAVKMVTSTPSNESRTRPTLANVGPDMTIGAYRNSVFSPRR